MSFAFPQRRRCPEGVPPCLTRPQRCRKTYNVDPRAFVLSLRTLWWIYRLLEPFCSSIASYRSRGSVFNFFVRVINTGLGASIAFGNPSRLISPLFFVVRTIKNLPMASEAQPELWTYPRSHAALVAAR